MGPAKHSALLAGLIALAALAATPAWAQKDKCDARSAVTTPIAAIQADYDAWRGKCVKVSGIARGSKLYADRMALAEPPLSSWEDSAHTITLKRRSGPQRDRTPQRVEVIGMVGSCADENAAIEEANESHPAEIFMTMGYCHTSLANYVAIASIRVIDKAPIARLSEAELPLERRPLVTAPADLPGVAAGQAKAVQMLGALGGRDRDLYARLAEPELVEDLDLAKTEGTPDWLRDRLRDSQVEFTLAQRAWRPFIARLSASRPDVTFIHRAELASPSDPHPSLIHCWCKTADCAGRWPVLSSDADNLPERPYACIATNGYLLGPGRETVIQATVPVETAGFAEPTSD